MNLLDEPQTNPTRRRLLHSLLAAPLLPWAGHAVAADFPARVYGANPVVSYLLAALAPEVFVGWNFPPPEQSAGYFSDAVLKKPVVGGFFGQGRTPNMEALLATRPQLAIISGATSVSTNESRKLFAQLNIPVQELTLNTAVDYPKAIEALGDWLGTRTRLQPVADFYRQLWQRYQQLPFSRPALVVYYAEQNDGLATECPNSLHAEVLRLVQANNPVTCPGGEAGKFGMLRISLESLYRMNPEWILTQDRATLSTFEQDSRYAELHAVTNHKLILAPQVPFRWIDRPPSFLRLLAAYWLYDRLYPGHHRFDLVSITQEFMQHFFNKTLNPAEAGHLLNPS